MEGTLPDILFYRTDDEYHSNVLPRVGRQECEVKWALRTLLQTKLVEVTEFQKSYLKS